MRRSFDGKCGDCEEEVEVDEEPEFCPRCGSKWADWEPDFSDVDFPVRIDFEYIWEDWELHKKWSRKTGHEEMPDGVKGKYAEASASYYIHEDGSVTTGDPK